MTARPTVGHKLLDEIERVSGKRERWRRYAAEAIGFGGAASFAPSIFLMTQAINAAKAAIAGDDGIACIAALRDLEGYDDQ